MKTTQEHDGQQILGDFVKPKYVKPGSFHDSSAGWNRIARELWAKVGDRVPREALDAIRRMREHRDKRQGKAEIKNEVRVLLAIYLGMPWEHNYGKEIQFITPQYMGGNFELSNLRLSKY